jgi:glucose/arabinose dehydrogenase
MKKALLLAAFSPLAVLAASCSAAPAGDNATAAPVADDAATPFTIERVAEFEEPWSMAFAPGTDVLFVTEKKGTLRGLDPDGKPIFVTGAPQVDYGGQGGFGDIAFLSVESGSDLSDRAIYLTWAEAGEAATRGAAMGRGRLVCEDHQSCEIRDLDVIWRQQPKVTGRGHYSHRIAFSPDGKYLFLASGDRQKMDPAQDVSNTLGSILRLMPDGSPAPGNPFTDRGSPSNEIWSYGHRNILGLAFDMQGQLWDVEHGPAGGDELNLVKEGANFGWPLVSNGSHYNGKSIPDHDTRPDLAAPAASWNPVIAPGDMIVYTGDKFPEWKGQVLIAAMKPAALVRVEIDGTTAREVARYPMEHRIRSIEQGPDGSIWLLEDGKYLDRSALLRLVPRGE